MKQKKHQKIGEVSKLLGIPSYVLRFWESEFQELKPVKTSTGQRLYTQADINVLRKIVHLRYDEKLTLSGAKSKLREISDPQQDKKEIQEIKQSLLEIKNSLQEILSDLR